jgi:membrane fusion protein, multidrug efflux system
MFQIHRPCAAAALCALLLFGCKKEEQAKLALAPTVKVAEVGSRDVPIFVEAIGQTRGNTEIEISTRVEGFLETVNFKEGSFVKKGQVLYTIDRKPFQAELAQAKANLAKSQAELTRVSQDVSRYEPLVAKNAVSVQELETAKAQQRAGQSAVAAAQAAVERAQIELDYTTVIAPDDGLIGTTEAHPGTLVGRGVSTLTHLSKVDPIHVRFTISERDYMYYARKRDEKLAAAKAAGKQAPATPPPPASDTQFQMVLADGSVHPHPGSLVFVDRAVDARTGTIVLEASFPNPGGTIRPGQFARVRASVNIKKGAVMVPQGAVSEVQGISNVAVVGADDTVEIRPIKPGERIGGLVVVDSGLKAGERIVVEGVQKIRSGVKVTPQLVALEEPVAATAPVPER